MEEHDIDILDITNPSKPKIVSETNLDKFAQIEPTRPHGDSMFSHDMVVKRIGDRDVMLMSYWDGGYVTSTSAIRRPAGRCRTPTSLRPTRPRLKYGQTITPEGNGHQAEFTRDNKYVFATDEDFDPYRVTATFKGGAANGKTFTAIQASGTQAGQQANPLVGADEYVGQGCDPVAPASSEQDRGRGAWDLRLPGQARQRDRGRLPVPDRVQPPRHRRVRDPGQHARGLGHPLGDLRVAPGWLPPAGVEPPSTYACGSASETDGTDTPPGPSVPVDISAVFDGWGYTHMYETNLAEGANMKEIAFYAPPEGQLDTYAENYGDMTVHEVATDPDKDLVYVSHYALGMRVLSYNAGGLKEVGKFVEAGGSNYWGVEVHKMNGTTYILGSDRDRGLRIFTFNG